MIKCRDLAELQIIETPADGPRDYSGFIDQNTYLYRMIDGQMVFRGVILGKGWENYPFKPENLSCYKERMRGDGEMGKKREKPSKEELQALWDKHGGKIDPIRQELNAHWGKVKKWLNEYGIMGTKPTQYHPADNDFTCEDEEAGVYQTEQAPPPESDQAANREPERESGETASTSILNVPCNTTVMPVGRELPPDDELQQQMDRMHRMAEVAQAEKAIAWSRNFEALANHKAEKRPRRREPWEEDCIIREQVESWLLDTYRMDVSKARKMEILGKLLDMEVGA